MKYERGLLPQLQVLQARESVQTSSEKGSEPATDLKPLES